MTSSFRSIAALGGGIVGLSAATAFARALPQAKITVVATPLDPAALADRMEGTLPAIKRFHRRIGIEEADLVSHAGTTHRVGTRFAEWSASGAAWWHCYGVTGLPDVPAFHQHWLRARRTGEAAPFDAYSPAVAIAAADRFAHPADDPAPPPADFDYALRLDPLGYRAALAALARHLRIAIEPGALGGVERREDGGVAALLLTDGRRIEADLYLDCSGPAAGLLSKLDDGFEDWREALPCDRLLLAKPGPPALSPADTAAATGCGWWWRSPGRARTTIGLAYASAITPDDEAARVLRSEIGQMPAQAITIRPGRRPLPWIRNVVALGDASVVVDPLAHANLHLAHSAILRALDLIPDRSCQPLLIAEYNRRTSDETTRVRDFLAAHYLASGRSNGGFWRAVRARKAPASLAETLQQFGERGRLPFFEEESFTRDDWLAVLLGMGMIPRRIDPAAETLGMAQVATILHRARNRAATAATGLAAYADYLAWMTAPR